MDTDTDGALQILRASLAPRAGPEDRGTISAWEALVWARAGNYERAELAYSQAEALLRGEHERVVCLCGWARSRRDSGDPAGARSLLLREFGATRRLANQAALLRTWSLLDLGAEPDAVARARERVERGRRRGQKKTQSPTGAR